MDTPNLKRYEVNVDSIGDVKNGICRLESDCVTKRVMGVIEDFLEGTGPSVNGKGRLLFDDRELERSLSTEIFITLSGLRGL